ncbi:MAG: hypothetical protein WB564_03900 [Dehalococcoidia bacterium]
MDDYAKLERLLADGYLIVGYVLPFSKFTPESIANTISVFSIQLAPEILLDPHNNAKSLVMLRHPSTSHQVEIVTSDERTISRANEQLRYQQEPIGTLIRARCAALGGRTSYQRIFHLDRLVASLKDLWGWDFKLGDAVGTFEVVIRLKSTDRGAIEETIDKLQRLLDCLAISQQVGFHIQHCSVAPIPRLEPSVSFGPEEMMLRPVAPGEIDNIEATLSSREVSVAARGLTQAYCETSIPSRLSMLWAAVEDVFDSKPKPLLNEEEVKYLVAQARGIESLRNDSDRLKRLKKALSDPDRMPLLTRNKRMANAIAPIMGMSVDDVYRKVRTASELRGKHGHQLLKNSENIEASEKFLQEALLCYLKKQKES